MSDVILKPCPFCSGEAKIYTQSYLDDDDESQEEHSALCTDCLATFPPEKSQQKAVEVWNKRHNEAPPTLAEAIALVEELSNGKWTGVPITVDDEWYDRCFASGEFPRHKLHHGAHACSENDDEIPMWIFCVSTDIFEIFVQHRPDPKDFIV